METKNLESVSRQLMLRNAYTLLRHKYRKRALWGFVADITGKGSTTSIEICRECGWNPHGDDMKPLKEGPNA